MLDCQLAFSTHPSGRFSLLSFSMVGNELGHVFQGGRYHASRAVGTDTQPPTKQSVCEAYGAVTTLPPDALTSFTAIAIQLRYSMPGKTGVLRNGTG